MSLLHKIGFVIATCVAVVVLCVACGELAARFGG